MRLHFSIGCYDCRWTSRRRQSIHFSRIQVLLLLLMCIDAPESTTNSLSSGSRVDGAGRHQFSEVRRMLLYLAPLILGCFWPASTLLHGHIALAIMSLPETDPQILEHLGLRWWGSPWQIIPSDGFWSRMSAWRATAFVNLHVGSVSVCLGSSVKSMKTSATPCPEIRNTIVVYFPAKPPHFCHHSFKTFCKAVHQPGDAHKSTFHQNLHPFLDL